jgi:hypothetical protein
VAALAWRSEVAELLENESVCGGEHAALQRAAGSTLEIGAGEPPTKPGACAG